MHKVIESYLSEVAAHLSALPTKQRTEELREMRLHLENAVIVSRELGQSEEEAAQSIVAQFGTPKDLGENVVQVWRRGEKRKKEIKMKKRIVFGTSSVLVLTATAWLVFMVAMVSRVLFPKNQIIIHASEGASLKVQHGVVQVLSAGSSGTGVEQFHSSTFFVAIAVPFVLLVGFAVVGCCSMLRPSRAA